MTTRLRAHRDDTGAALIIAITIMSIAMGLMLISATVAVRTDRTAGVDRQRTTAVAAAESGVDAAYATIQNSGLSLPCAWPTTGYADTGARPDITQVQAVITYYYKATPTATDLTAVPAGSCGVAATYSPVQAKITSTATTTVLAGGTDKGTRTVEALVNLSPVYGNGFNKAIFADGNIELQNNHKILGSGSSPDADIYSNHSVLCPNGSNQDIKGSIFSQDAISWPGQCSAAGDVWAKNALSLGHNQTTIGGRVISSRSTATLVQAASKISGTVTAGSTISWSNCGTKCFANTAPIDPPSQPFPLIKGDAASLAEWVANGYTRVDEANCTTVADRIVNTHMAQTQDRLIVTPCHVTFRALNTKLMKSNIVIFASGGFDTQNQVEFKSDSTAVRKLYWIVPADGTPCTTARGIDANNNFTIASTVNLFMYTPCDAVVSNHATDFGQIYGGGKVTIDNNYDMTFKPLPVFGVDVSSLPTLSYNVSVVFKREIR